MTDADTVLVERDGPVTIVSINRPHCRNAVDGATARKLFDAFRAFDADDEASVAVFTGTGGYFCAGADLKAVASGDPNKKREIGGHDSDRADGAEPAAAVKTGDRRGGRFCGGRRHGAGAVGRHARGRRGCDLRHLLPPLRRAADRSRHHPAAAADRAFAGDRSHSDGTPGRRRRGAAHGPCQPSGAQRAKPARMRLRWRRISRASRKPACAPTGFRRCGNGTWKRKTPSPTKCAAGSRSSRQAKRCPARRALRPASGVTARSAGRCVAAPWSATSERRCSTPAFNSRRGFGTRHKKISCPRAPQSSTTGNGWQGQT